MALRRRTHTHTRNDVVEVEKGTSLARGPALIIGTALLAFGLLGFLQDATTPMSSSFPDGSATGGTWLGFEINGWTNFFTAAAGGLLLFGAAQHLLAKTMSLLVGLALGASAVIALIDGDVLGLAAANGWTELGWGIVAAVLLVNTLLPRTGRRVAEPPVVHDDRTRDDGAVAPAPVAAAPRDRNPDGDRAGDPATTHGDRTADPATTNQDRVVDPVATDGDRVAGTGTTTTAGGVRGPAAPADEPRTRRL